MNRSYTLIAVSVLVAVSFMGCLRPDPTFESPITTWPKVTVDFVENVTKVYVKALDDYRYTNVTMRVFHGNVTYSKTSETNTYVMARSIAQREFTLNITVWDQQKDKEKIFTFEGNFTVNPAGEPDVILQISIWKPVGDPKVYKLKENDFPKGLATDRIQ